jgi:hypothetical protein
MIILAKRVSDSSGCRCSDCFIPAREDRVLVVCEDLGERNPGWLTACYHWDDRYAWSAVKLEPREDCDRRREMHDYVILRDKGIDIENFEFVEKYELRRPDLCNLPLPA